jgi:hypothetical protein
MQLVQQKNNRKKEFIVSPTGLRIRTTRGKGMPAEETVPFENIRSDRFAYQQLSYGYLACGGVFFLIATLVFLDHLSDPQPFYLFLAPWGMLSAASFLLFFLHRPRRYFLKTFTGNYIRFYTGADDGALDRFVEQLLQARNEYLLKYTGLTPHLSYERQYSNLQILHRDGVIGTEEYSRKMEELNHLFDQTAPKQVFSTFSPN